MSLILPRRKLIALAAPALILPGRSRAQGGMAPGPGTPAAAAANPWTFKTAANNGGQNTFTITGVNMTGVDLILIGVASGGTAPTVTDSSSNTYTTPFTVTNGTGFKSSVKYKQAPTVTSSMTFTATGSGIFCSMIVMGFSGSIASPLDQTNTPGTSTTGSTTVATGAITPGHANELVVTHVGANEASGGGVFSLSGTGGTYTIASQIPETGSYQGGGFAYVFQSSATSTNQTWTDTVSANGMNAIMMSFRSQ